MKISLGMTAAIALSSAAAVLGSAQGRTSTNDGEVTQLHTAIVHGDTKALRYWLEERSVDPNSRDAEGITPLQRCLRLAANVIDRASSDRNRRNGGGISPAPVTRRRPLEGDAVFGVPTVGEMVTILHQHGARPTQNDQAGFSAAVVSWYKDVISRPAPQLSGVGKPKPAVPRPAPALPPPPSNAINVHLDGQRDGALQVTYRNTTDRCVTFDPLVLGSDGVNVPVSSLVTLGHPITSLSLDAGKQMTVFFGIRVGRQTPVARNVRSC